MLGQIEQPILDFAADGVYDKRKVYDSLTAHSPEVNILIPPRKNARIWKHGNTKTERLKRDEKLLTMRKDGHKEWKKNAGYHVRSGHAPKLQSGITSRSYQADCAYFLIYAPTPLRLLIFRQVQYKLNYTTGAGGVRGIIFPPCETRLNEIFQPGDPVC